MPAGLRIRFEGESGVTRFFLQSRPALRTRFFSGVLIALSMAGSTAFAEIPLPPQLGGAGRDDFAAYLAADQHKAFAIAPGGSWAWVAGEDGVEPAERKALARCAEHTEQRCVVYAVDQRRRFDEKNWLTLWRLPATAAGTTGTTTRLGESGTGLIRGAIFPDLVFADGAAKSLRLSALRGQVVVLHFWGSWCAPCRHELPDMAAIAATLSGQGVRFVPLQVRESIDDARHWLSLQRIRLDIYDSGVRHRDDGDLPVAGGGRLPDRAVAPVFPSSIVLDRQGRIVFRHHGPIERWADYAPMLRALARP